MVLYSTTYPVIELPPSLELSSHLTVTEVEDVALMDTLVGAEGAIMCDGQKTVMLSVE